jgi:hypothetical protein
VLTCSDSDGRLNVKYSAPISAATYTKVR